MTERRVTVTCACGREHTVDVTPDPGDERGPLVMLARGWQGIRGATLSRWAREGRLKAFALERGRLCAWEADIRSAVEAAPYSAPEPSDSLSADDDALLRDSRLELVQ